MICSVNPQPITADLHFDNIREVHQMADEIVYKKVTRKADRLLEGKVVAKHGKQTNQKLKPYVVLQYLLKYSIETILNRE